MKSIFAFVVALVLVSSAVASAMSIETDPVRVTHRNSGPRYEIDEVERAKQVAKEAAANTAPQPSAENSKEASGPTGQADDETPTVGHVAIRRVFLFPIMRPADPAQPDSAETNDGQPPHMAASGREHEDAPTEPRMPILLAKPFWPFMTPARPVPGSHQQSPPDEERPHIIRHLFGTDQASRSPSNNGERDQDKAASNQVERANQPHRAIFDPIQMMMDMMHQAISSQLGPNFSRDLSSSNNNKDREETVNNDDNSPAESSDERPMMPMVPMMPGARFGPESNLFDMKPGAQNETREDIVEIEGKKYLRKTVVNKHVGDNIVFMTRRLVFIPLNETDSTETATTNPTNSVPTGQAKPGEQTRPAPAGNESDEVPSMPGAKRDEASKPEQPSSITSTTTTTTSTTTTTTEVPTTTSASAEITTQPSTTAAPVEPSTTTSEQLAVTSSKSNAAERLVEAPNDAAAQAKSATSAESSSS